MNSYITEQKQTVLEMQSGDSYLDSNGYAHRFHDKYADNGSRAAEDLSRYRQNNPDSRPGVTEPLKQKKPSFLDIISRRHHVKSIPSQSVTLQSMTTGSPFVFQNGNAVHDKYGDGMTGRAEDLSKYNMALQSMQQSAEQSVQTDYQLG